MWMRKTEFFENADVTTASLVRAQVKHACFSIHLAFLGLRLHFSVDGKNNMKTKVWTENGAKTSFSNLCD